MNYGNLAELNAILNLCAFILLIIGFYQIKNGSPLKHKRLMLSALVVSALFLLSYSVYHKNVGSVPYPHHDWTRTLYYAILIPHIFLAAVMSPFIIIIAWFGLKGKYGQHKQIARFVLPVWLFVSLSGIAVYLMLYQM